MNKTVISVIFVILLVVSIVLGATSYKINISQVSLINEFSTAKTVNNTGSYALFIPTATNAEWQAAYTNFPPGVSYVAAQCTSGACCNTSTGRYLPALTVCRSSVGSCDIAENCTGSSNACPSDTAHGWVPNTSYTVTTIRCFFNRGSAQSDYSDCVGNNNRYWGVDTNTPAYYCYDNDLVSDAYGYTSTHICKCPA